MILFYVLFPCKEKQKDHVKQRKKASLVWQCVYSLCVCGHWDSILLTPTRWQGQRVLRISLSMSTCSAKPHHWKHILLRQLRPLAQSSAALHFFSWLTGTQTAWGVRPQPPKAKFRPCNWSLTFILRLCASAWVSYGVYGHAKRAWVCRDTSFPSKTPIRARSKMPGDIHSRAGRWVLGLGLA